MYKLIRGMLNVYIQKKKCYYFRREQFVNWTESLPDNQNPSWLGLPNNAEKVLLTTLGSNMLLNLLKMQLLEDEDDLAYVNKEKEGKGAEKEKRSEDGRPAWMRTLLNSLQTWLKLVPKVGAMCNITFVK
jgi:dynein heavy chain 1